MKLQATRSSETSRAKPLCLRVRIRKGDNLSPPALSAIAKRIMSHNRFWNLYCLGLALVAFLSLSTFTACTNRAAPAGFERPPAPVTVSEAAIQDVPVYLDAIGNTVKFFKGAEFTISRPPDLWRAWTEIMSRIVKFRIGRRGDSAPSSQ